MNFPIDQSSTNAEKIALFRTLFVGREDVFARRYENVKKGTSGYSPCCWNQWGYDDPAERAAFLNGPTLEELTKKLREEVGAVIEAREERAAKA